MWCFRIERDYNYTSKVILRGVTLASILTLIIMTILLDNYPIRANEVLNIALFHIRSLVVFAWVVELGMYPLMTLISYFNSDISRIVPEEKSDTIMKSLKPWLFSLVIYLVTMIIWSIISFGLNESIMMVSAIQIIGFITTPLIITIGIIIYNVYRMSLSRTIFVITVTMIMMRVIYYVIFMLLNAALKSFDYKLSLNWAYTIATLECTFIVVLMLYKQLKTINLIDKLDFNINNIFTKKYGKIFSLFDKVLIVATSMFFILVIYASGLDPIRFSSIEESIRFSINIRGFAFNLITFINSILIIYSVFNYNAYINKKEDYLSIVPESNKTRFFRYMTLPIILWVSYFITAYYTKFLVKEEIGPIASKEMVIVEIAFTLVCCVYVYLWRNKIKDRDKKIKVLTFFYVLTYLVALRLIASVWYDGMDYSVIVFIVMCVIFIILERIYWYLKKKLKRHTKVSEG